MRNSMSPRTLSLLAGFLVMASTIPDFADALMNPEVARPSKIARDSVACIGNLLWVRFGYATKVIAIKVFCSLAALMLGVLVLRQLWTLLPTTF